MDKQYEKPVIISADDMAEGVFAGSGNQVLALSNFQVKTSGNADWKNIIYDFDLTNNSGTDLTGASYIFTITKGNATGVTSYSANAVINGNQVIVTPTTWNNIISAGATYSVELIINYEGESFEMN